MSLIFFVQFFFFLSLPGGGKIIPETGVISGGVCTSLSPLSTGAHLELQVRDVFYVSHKENSVA